MPWLRTTAAALALWLVELAPLGRCADNDHVAAAALPRADAGAGFLRVPVSSTPWTAEGGLSERAAIQVMLDNQFTFYSINISLGTPPQAVTVLVDTGSAELWVDPDCSTAPSLNSQVMCQAFGRYVPSKSKTPPYGPFGSHTIFYGDASDTSTQTSVKVQYYGDVLRMGSATVTNQTFGVVVSSSGQSQGILGLAPDLHSGFAVNTPYSLVLNSLANQKVISSRVFSLDLRHQDEVQGAIIYGGVDKSRFTGPLVRVPIVPDQSGLFRLAATLSSVGYTTSGGLTKYYPLTNDSSNVMLDSGTTLSRLRASLASPILDDLGAMTDVQGYYLAKCSLRRSGASIAFSFANDATVAVPLSDLILDLQADSAGNWCYIALTTTTDQQILGDAFLRAGYFVFDWDNQNIHMAQAAGCGTDVVAVGSGTGAVPSVTGNCAASSAAPASTTNMLTAGPSLLPTASAEGVYTTTFTVSTCPSFDTNCRTGVVTTETITPSRVVATGSATTTGASGSTESAKSTAGTSRPWMGWFIVIGMAMVFLA